MNETLQIVRNVAGAEEEEASYNFKKKISFECFDGLPAKTSRLGPDQLLSEVLRDRRQIDVQFEFEERERTGKCSGGERNRKLTGSGRFLPCSKDFSMVASQFHIIVHHLT